MPMTRTAPPSEDANNQDLFVWALYALGGADEDIDVEAVYLKSFELAPARLGWRTRPDLPDYKKTAKALQSVEASTHPGLIVKRGAYQRRLTAEGVRWVERNRPLLERLYGGRHRVAEVATSAHGQRRLAVRSSEQFLRWRSGGSLDLQDLADTLECSPASPASVWDSRLNELRRVADVTGDADLRRFAEVAAEFVADQRGGRR